MDGQAWTRQAVSEHLEELWLVQDEDDEDKDSEAENDEDGEDAAELEVSAVQVGKFMDQIFEKDVRPLLGANDELGNLAQDLTTKQQRTLREQMREARKKYLKKHEGNQDDEY